MIRFGAPLEKVLYSIREWFEGDFPRWYVEATPLRVEDARLREWTLELGVGRRLQDPLRQAAHRQGQPTGVCAQVPIHGMLGGHQLILMATEYVDVPNRAQVWRPYQWRDGPLEVGPFELVERRRSGPTRCEWRLRPEMQDRVEAFVSRKLNRCNHEGLSQLRSLITEMLPRIDGIQGRVLRRLEEHRTQAASRSSGVAVYADEVGAAMAEVSPEQKSTVEGHHSVLQQELAGFARLRREAEASGIAQDGPLSEKAVREILAGMSRGVR